MKNMRPVELRLTEPLADGYRLWPVADQWSEMLPERIPLRFSIFRYLGFYVTETTGGKTSVLRSKRISALTVTIRNDDKVVFRERVGTAFRNGVFYVQDVCLDRVGTHTVVVEAEGKLAPRVAPLELTTRVFEFMELRECDERVLQGGYQPLREFALDLIERGQQDKLRDEAFCEAFLKKIKLPLRKMDVRWWLRTFVEHTLDREARQKLQHLAAAANSCRTNHKRKQAHPSRAADKKEHDNLFDRRRREWKRVRHGNLRMFTNEPLHAGKTVTVYSAKEMYLQLSQYAQI